jgi:hypothetical protein
VFVYQLVPLGVVHLGAHNSIFLHGDQIIALDNGGPFTGVEEAGTFAVGSANWY